MGTVIHAADRFKRLRIVVDQSRAFSLIAEGEVPRGVITFPFLRRVKRIDQTVRLALPGERHNVLQLADCSEKRMLLEHHPILS